jgi:hypothetical protein
MAGLGIDVYRENKTKQRCRMCADCGSSDVLKPDVFINYYWGLRVKRKYFVFPSCMKFGIIEFLKFLMSKLQTINKK